MPSTLKTPGVYVEEIVKFPPSVAQVETAIPAFIGYTEKATKKITGDLNEVPTRITSLLEYERFFGGPKAETTIEVTVTDDADDNRSIVVTQPTSKEPFLMYYSLQLYFANGGGPCYIVSVGRYGTEISADDTTEAAPTKGGLDKGLPELAKVDEPTLILFPDATRLTGGTKEDDFYGLYNDALNQCNKLQDRFTIIDTMSSDGTPGGDQNVIDLRNKISSEKDYAKYGAAYYPHLETILNYAVDSDRILITHIDNHKAAGVIDKVQANLTLIDNDLSNKVDEIIATLGSFSTTGFSGTLAEVIKYLYNDNDVVSDPANEGFNLGEVDGDPKDFSGDRPSNLSDKLGDLLTNLGELITLKNKAKVEVIASKSALTDELSSGDIDDIQTAADALVNLFENTIEDKYDELTQLHNALKKHIVKKDTAEIESVIETGTSNIADVVASFLAGAFDPLALADGTTTDFDDIVTNWDALKLELDGKIALDTNNGSMHGRTLTTLETDDNATYNEIKTAINSLPMELPPSSAIAGVYARIDSTRGVWKAPANVSLNYVIKPTVRVTNDIQDGLNVDTTAGKSINAIRSFTGKGVMVWGARTLAGNDNEWRYVSVRRFFNMVEESVKKASDQFVFEANDANTWVRIRSMIENFLTNQWKAGALAGATTDEAYYVKVGLNQTMTADDILNGIMNVEIGMAVVRPAEFIVLKFSHKMQES
ncbi:phage tail sheath C-terminal domain-containing protein [Kordia sp.]|uniref:phage tail sheath C-terminal domain-containing protein n=1 Tax=Kordia sp. TaxID=1965332 RepID=UPI003B5C28AB